MSRGAGRGTSDVRCGIRTGMGDAPASVAAAPARTRLRWTTLLVGIVASAATAVLATWPLATALDGAVPTNEWHCLGRACVDNFLCVWIVVEGAKRLLHDPTTLFEANILHP